MRTTTQFLLLLVLVSFAFTACDGEPGVDPVCDDHGCVDPAEGGNDLGAAAAITGTTYYVDCNAASGGTGRSQTSAYRSISQAQAAPLTPGDGLLFRRGCTWNLTTSGTLFEAKWNGTATHPIIIGAYGTGALPVFRLNAGSTVTSQTAVNLTGSHLILQDIHATLANAVRDSACKQSDGTGVRLGWYVGFQVGGSYNTVKRVDGEHTAIGVNFTDASTHGSLQSSHLHNLDALWRVDRTHGALGAVGVNLHGTDHDLGYNLFENNAASCTLSDGTLQSYSAPFEAYNLSRTKVHHNRAYRHRKHFEMGHGTGLTSADNVLAYNLFVSSEANARGPNIHGADNPFGPIDRTTMYNNTIVFTGAGSQALLCGCSGGARLENNIFIAEAKAAYLSGAVVEKHNLYWDFKVTSDTTADPLVQMAAGAPALSSTSKLADPRFVDWAHGDYHLATGSPAIDTASSTAVNAGWTADLDQTAVPQGPAPDVGAFER